ncbi:MAG: hypothetical protein WCI91_01070 [Candidatus Nomurabacteria bacterium]
MENLQNKDIKQQTTVSKKSFGKMIIPSIFIIISGLQTMAYISHGFTFNKGDGPIVFPFLSFIIIISIISIFSENKKIYNTINYILIISVILVFIISGIAFGNSFN